MQGSESLTGGVDKNEKMGLFGKTGEGMELIISANTSGNTTHGNYALGNKQKTLEILQN